MLQPGTAPASPCRHQCKLNEQQVCQGCGRTIDNFVRWTKLSLAEKQQCVGNATARLDALDNLFD